MSEFTTEDVLENVSDEYVDDVDTDLVESEIESFSQFGVSGDELQRGVLTNVAKDLDITHDELVGGDGGGGSNGTAPLTDIGDIDESDEWYTIEAEVVQLWDNDTESISQVGLLDDGTGRAKFVAWAKSDLTLLAEGEQYRFENVVSEEYQGNMQVKLNSSTDISVLQGDEKKDISNDIEMTGSLVALQSGSGLIERCPEEDCSRPLKNDRCSEHGDVEGEHDLRIKAVLDNGHETQKIVCDAEMTEELTGIGLDEATDMAMEALDKTVVAEEMRPELLGRYYTVSGAKLGDLILVEEMEQTTEIADTEDLLVKARAI